MLTHVQLDVYKYTSILISVTEQKHVKQVEGQLLCTHIYEKREKQNEEKIFRLYISQNQK